MGRLMHPKATDRQKGYHSQLDQDRISHLQTRRYAILITSYWQRVPECRVWTRQKQQQKQRSEKRGGTPERQDGPMATGREVSIWPGWPLPAGLLGTPSPSSPWAGEIWSRSEAAQTCAQKPANLERRTACSSQAAST